MKFSKTLTGICAGVLGLAIGGATASGGAPAPTATPAAVKTVTVDREVKITTIACKTALDDADRVIGISGDALGSAADGFGAIARGDLAGVQTANDEISAATPKM